MSKLQLQFRISQQSLVPMEDAILEPALQHRATSTEHANPFFLSPPPVRQHRPSNTVSMYVGIGKPKLLPKPPASFHLPPASRRSESTHAPKTEQKGLTRYRKLEVTTNDASFSALNPLKEFKRQTLRGKVRAGLVQTDRSFRSYLGLVEKAEGEFLGHCAAEREEEYTKAAEVIIRLLNYSVDFNLPESFLRALKVLADFHLQTDKLETAIFYFDQAREACLLLGHTVLLVESLIGLAACCGKVGAENEGIKILKKALEYAWMRGLEELELRIFDEIGRLHYYLGDLQKARQYHSRHINALHEPLTSALRQLSRQRIAKSEELNLETKYKQIDRILLVHLKLPIRNLEQVPLPFEEASGEAPIRRNFDMTIKFFAGKEAAAEIRHILRGWFFRDEIEDPSLPEQDWSATKPKKYAFLDFQLNQQLRKLEGTGKGKGKGEKGAGRSAFPVKESVEEQIARIIKEPPLETDWYETIVKQINRDHRNKLLNVRHAVRMRGFNKKVIPSLDTLKDIYNSLFERSRHFSAQLQSQTFLN